MAAPEESSDGRQKRPSVSATELVRDIGGVRERVLDGPIQITSHGRAEMVLLSQADFNRLQNTSSNDVDRLEAKLRTVIDTVDTIIIIFDQDLKVRRANRAYCDHFGRQATDVIGMSVWDLVNNPGDQFLAIRMRDVLKSGKEERFEMPSTYREGRQMRFVIKPWPLGIAFFARDVTEELQASDRVLRDIALDHSLAMVPGVGTGVVDNHAEIIMASRSLAMLLGTTPRALLGTSIFNIFHPEDRHQLEGMLAQSVTEARQVEIRYLRDGTEYRSCEVATSSFFDSRRDHCSALAIHDPGLRGKAIGS